MTTSIYATIFYEVTDQCITSLARQTKANGSEGKAKIRVKESAPQNICYDCVR